MQTQPRGNGHDPMSNPNESGARPMPVPSERPLSDLFKELVDETQGLARAEVRLVRSEVDAKLEQAKSGLGHMAYGAAVFVGGLLSLLAAAVFALAQVLPLWSAALVVGALASIVGVQLLRIGQERLAPASLTPDRSLQEAKNNQDFIKEIAR